MIIFQLITKFGRIWKFQSVDDVFNQIHICLGLRFLTLLLIFYSWRLSRGVLLVAYYFSPSEDVSIGSEQEEVHSNTR